MVGLLLPVLAQEAFDLFRPEQPRPAHRVATQEVVHHRRQRALEPGRHGHSEPLLLLRAVEHLLREEVPDGVPEEAFSPESPHVVGGREGEGELHHVALEERRPHLEAHGHARPIHPGQDVVGQVGPGVEVHGPDQGRCPLRVGPETLRGLEGHGLRVQRVQEVRRQEVALLAGREGGHPQHVVGRRLGVGTSEEAQGLEPGGGLASRNRETPDGGPKGPVEGRRHRPRQGRHPMGSMHGTAGEELVAAIPPQRHLHVLPGEAREKGGGDDGGVADGLVQETAQLGNEIGDLRGVHPPLLVPAPDPIGHGPGGRALVEARIVEGDGERVQGAVPGGEGRHGARVDLAGEEDSQGHVGDQP